MSGLHAKIAIWILFVLPAIHATGADDSVPSFLPQGRSKAFFGVASVTNTFGAVVSSVVPQSSAFENEIKPGDIVKEVDGFPVGIINGLTYSLPSEIRRSGEEIRLIIRDANTGLEYGKVAKVGGRGTNKGDPNTIPALGVTSKIDSRGETILQVLPNTPAEVAGLLPGDLVTHVDGYRVAMIGVDAFSLASEIRHSPSGCSLTIWRAGQQQNIVISFGRRPLLTSRVHILLMGATDDPNVGQSIISNLSMMEELLKDIPNSLKGTVKRIDGANCHANVILNEIRNLNVAPNEAVFVYFGGHGGFDPNVNFAQDPAGGHYFYIPTGSLMRKTVWDSLAGKQARLTVLITDTCNVPVAPTNVKGAGLPMPPPEPPIVTLLFRHRGMIDISGTSRNQFGWSIPKGGIFTEAFTQSAKYSSGNWGDVLRSTSDTTKQSYLDLKQTWLASPTLSDDLRNMFNSQAEQSPQAFQFDVRQD